MVERVAVIGAGIAGLCTALALAPTGREITLYERDPPPPDGGPEEAFEDWARRGVGHLRQSHGFLARMRSLIVKEHPELMADLLAGGVRDMAFVDGLPDSMRKTYVPEPGDEELAVLISRRTTMEFIIRRYVERQANVRIASGAFVKRMISERDAAGALKVTGLVIDDADGEHEVLVDLVVDGGGRLSSAIDWLAEAGVEITEKAETCAILYFTRFYRLLEGQEEPERGPAGGTGDLGYVKFGVFAADHRTFSITLAVPEVEQQLRLAVMKPEVFETICAQFPGIAPWTDPAKSAPVSKVYGMGDLKSRWREFAPEGKPTVLGYIPIGDAVVRTNPLYGRGCSFAMVEAHLLRDVLEETADPGERLLRYCAKVREQLEPFYKEMLTQDRSAARRAETGLDPAYKPSWRGKLMRSFAEDGVGIAIRTNPDLLRQAMRAFHMLAPPGAWFRRPRTLAKISATWAKGKRANAGYYAPKPGPGRAEMFERLGLSTTADLETLKAA